MVVGDPEHGVARYARHLADAIRGQAGIDRALALPSIADLPADLPPGTPVHLHVTDRLLAASPEEASLRVERLAASTRLTVTLHDLPQHSDGERNLPRRVEFYRRTIAAARGVVVNSNHEAALLREFVGEAHELAVIPLPVDTAGAGATASAAAAILDDTVAIVGFVYPGKGHAEVVDAVASLSGPRRVVALGAPSPGHTEDVEAIAAAARARGVTFEVTGFLPDDTMLERCATAGVPVAAHRHVSASGSIATWIAAGRRPLIPDSRYSREVSERAPGTVTLYPPDAAGLASAIDRARREPATTLIAPGTATGPDLAQTAARYLDWFAGVPE